MFSILQIFRRHFANGSGGTKGDSMTSSFPRVNFPRDDEVRSTSIMNQDLKSIEQAELNLVGF